jgi:hypothetical protein
MKPNSKMLRRCLRPGSTCLVGVGALVAMCRPAYAYVDPGTGGLIVQLLLGGVAGAAVIAKLYWEKLTGLFKRKPPRAPDSEQQRQAINQNQPQDARRE